MKNLDNSLASFLEKAELKPLEPKGKGPSNGQDTPFSSAFLIELVHRIKNTLTSIKKFTLVSADKFDDKEFRKQSLNKVTEDIRKIDSVLNSLLNYISINTPIVKSETLHLILEEILEANEKQLQNKQIKIFKKLEKDLPETSMHDEQVRFILNSIFQYAILSTPTNGIIGFLIKSLDGQKETPDKKISPKKNGAYIEVDIGFMSNHTSSGQSERTSGTAHGPKEEGIQLILALVKEIIQKNRGEMIFQVDKKKPRTLITLKFPIERRKVIYYEPIAI
jgi:light-regulated signal transduction histidine kinase (bacteriophytochrome)